MGQTGRPTSTSNLYRLYSLAHLARISRQQSTTPPQSSPARLLPAPNPTLNLASPPMASPPPPKLPVPGRRNVLITSALPYVNNVPHLGNIIGCVLSADVFARYCRLRGYNVIYICGTDEYGTATETKAMEEKCSPKEICDKYHAVHSEVYKWFDIKFDKFGRTSSPQQTEVCQAIFRKLMENNWLTENTMQQLYCDTCQRFLADRLVEGKCPTEGCNYEAARGDQCENCSKLLNPTELIDPKCKVCKNTPRIRDTDHLFLELPLLKDKLVNYINETSVTGMWSQNAIQATNAWLKEGLKSRCITRDLKWGVPVPHEKYKDKVFYVWFDAPIGYISITASYTPDWEKWWKDPENVELFQFMGKDNVPFHTVMFPSTLLGTGEKWTMMKTISVTEYLNYEAGKFSKSHGIGVFGNDAKDTNIPPEVWRYYLLTNRPEVSDTLFTWADLQAKLNSELLNNLGNFINRVLSFVAKPAGAGYDSIIPDAPNAESHPLTKALAEKTNKWVEQYLEAMEKVKLKQGLKSAMGISSDGNAYLQESQFWKLYKEDPAACAVVMKTSVGLVYLLACLLEPFMPSFSIEVLRQLNLSPEESLSFCDNKGESAKAERPWEFVPAGHKIGKPSPLFKELKDEEVESFRNRFAGSQAERNSKAQADAEAKKVADKLKGTKLSEGGQKKEQKKQSGGSKSKNAEVDVTVAKLDIRVGLIRKAEKHPDADSLYVEEIDVGEEAPRTVVSGLVKYIPLEEMQNRKVCVLCNLKPVAMRGIKSHAMVLAASNEDHTKVELVEPPESAAVGERVTFAGYSGEPEASLSGKSKTWEKLSADLHSNGELVACYKDVAFTTSAGVCKVKTIANGEIR
ncbi:probable methionine--tRNA ligase [Oryza brachyantha]|uniref:probable methionine--tRNA ligase n=1 Tax=Oryza brachyantha TaxID=4533 RepID=UPI001ADCC3A5|nr:probable methionine--tRNA ligase [Oryza brachyantha]